MLLTIIIGILLGALAFLATRDVFNAPKYAPIVAVIVFLVVLLSGGRIG